MNDTVLLTKNGLKELEKEYEWRYKNERKRIADDIDKARQQGDLSENASYKAALEDKEFNEVKIKELGDIIQNAKVVNDNNSSKINIGSNIIISEKSSSIKKSYTIVGENEADPSKRKISFKSPLAVSLMGKKKGDEFDFITPSGKTKYIIMSVE